MKHILIIITLSILFLNSFSQKIEIGVNGIAGYTSLDIENAVGKPLSDWDQFSYGGNLLGIYHLNNNWSIGFEAGFHRLYYWEYTYSGYNYETEWRWGEESTIHFGPVVELNQKNLFGQAGLNIRTFTDGTGTVPAILLGCGYQISISKSLVIPIGLRSDIVFGTGTPTSICASIGLRYKINKESKK